MTTRCCGGESRPAVRPSTFRWNVSSEEEALKVLKSADFKAALEGGTRHPLLVYFFKLNSGADIRPGDRLWCAMKKLAQKYAVEVFPMLPGSDYVPWKGRERDLRRFDCIKISAR